MQDVDWGSMLSGELRSVVLGNQIGQGQYRKVFECKLDPTVVIKIEDYVSNVFSNALEWHAWEDFKDFPRIADWLAPCISISAFGAILVMKKVTPLVGPLPKRLPSFLSADVKPQNFGMYEGRIVKCDYPNLNTEHPLKKVPVTWSVPKLAKVR